MVQFSAWWVIIQLFGLAALPLTRRVFAWLPERGYAFSKTVGLLLVSYLLWLGATTGILTNSLGGITVALLLVAALSLSLEMQDGIGNLRGRVDAFWNANKTQILAVEALFLLTFAGWALVRAYAPDKILFMSGEKFMETGFLNGVLNSPHFPPLDPWLSGYGISYYYFGYVMMGLMTRFSGVIPTVGFDLYDALLFGLTAVTAYGVVANLILGSGGSRRAASEFGLLGALFVGGMGNLEGLLEGLYSSRSLPAIFWTWIDIPGLTGSVPTGTFFPGYDWWWWRASRVVIDLDLFNKPIPVQPIDEFPFFSFLLGDNHPHKLALPFVLLAIGLALNLLLRQIQGADGPGGPDSAVVLTGWRKGLRWFWLRRCEAGLLLFYALALGSLAFLNTWDFPIYLGLVLLAYGLGRYLSNGKINLGLAARFAALAAVLGVGAVLLYIFFYTGFASQAGGVLPYVFPPTRIEQYLVMFGPFIFILAFFAFTAVRQKGYGFPFRKVLRTWLWIAGLSYGVFLLAVLLGVAVISAPGSPLGIYLNAIFGDLSIGQGVARVLLIRLTQPWLFLLLSILLAVTLTGLFLHREPASIGAESESPALHFAPPGAARFALLLAFSGLALTLIVEFFYLRDNFGARMNTVFKFYFPGWVMLACASAYGVWWVSRTANRLSRIIFQAGTVLLVAAGLVYTGMGIFSRVNGFKLAPNLDAAASYAGDYPQSGTYSWIAHPDDWAAIQWLRANGQPAEGESDSSVPIILEAGGGAYENAGRISAFTGFPTLLGWTNHEGQWRGSQKEIKQREPVIQTIFTTYDAKLALNTLQQWRVRYVIIGDTERQYVAQLCQDPTRACSSTRALDKFSQILSPVFQKGNITVYQVPDLVQP